MVLDTVRIHAKLGVMLASLVRMWMASLRIMDKSSFRPLYSQFSIRILQLLDNNIALLEILGIRKYFHNVVPIDDIFAMDLVTGDFHDVQRPC
jgi:hypothetical protein